MAGSQQYICSGFGRSFAVLDFTMSLLIDIPQRKKGNVFLNGIVLIPIHFECQTRLILPSCLPSSLC